MPFLTIAFPVFDPIAIAIGPIAIRWYALAYIGGIVLGWLYARALIKNEKLWGGPAPITLPQMDDFILWVTVGIILGGRTGYVLFYNLPFFIQHPAEIFELWKGGMSFHGGFLGCVAAVMLVRPQERHFDPVARRHHHRGRRRSACCSGASPISSTASCGAGRRIPACPGRWCFPMAGRCRAIPASFTRRGSRASCCSSILAVMIRIGALKRPGLILGSFIAIYAFARIIGEFFREPDPQLGFLWGGLTMGMLLSVPMIIAGAILIVVAWRRTPPNQISRPRDAVTEYSPLQSEIKKLIKSSGPMPVWRYMELCLTHPSTAITSRAIRWGARAISPPRPKSARCSANCSGCGRRRCGRRSVRRRCCG